MRQAGKETSVGVITSERKVFDNPFFTVVERVVKTPEGMLRDLQLLWDRSGKQFVIGVAFNTDGKIILVEESKYGQMRRMISAPTGGIKKRESPVNALKREFLAETGYMSNTWTRINTGPIVDFADKSDGGEHFIFLGFETFKVQEPRDPEQKVILVTQDELIWRVLPSGRVPAMSIAALMLAMR